MHRLSPQQFWPLWYALAVLLSQMYMLASVLAAASEA
jgi:hypothetical protein